MIKIINNFKKLQADLLSYIYILEYYKTVGEKVVVKNFTISINCCFSFYWLMMFSCDRFGEH